MKKTLLKVALIVVFSLLLVVPGRALVNFNPDALSSFKFVEKLSPLRKKIRDFSYLLAMGTQQNLRAYHLGLRSLFPGHRVPSSLDLFDSIRSHPNFFGLLTKSEALESFSRINEGFLIFEEKNRDAGHFYIMSSEGLRHFTVNQMNFAGIDNGDGIQYPCLTYFLRSTAVL